MYNIRIKQLPKTGDQRNFSLVDRNDLYIKVNPINQDTNVKNTISAVPREKANIEAEGGETVIGDINNDGFLEHSKIVGKRHTQGGVPLNVAPGSFIFSDTKKLKIKDPEVLSIFGITNFDKSGITPAKIASKYQMNNYMNILKDDATDPITKRTATQMLKNNLEKLGMLALVQESMKGFPDGIPAIAESVMAGLQGQQSPGQEQGEGVAHEVMEGKEEPGEQEGQMRYGGLYKAQTGKIVGTDFQGHNQTREDVDKMKALQKQMNANQTSNNTIPTETASANNVNDTINYDNPIVLNDVNVSANIRQHKIPTVGDVYYINGAPLTVSEIEKSSAGDWLPNWINDPSGVYFKTNEGKKAYLSFDEFKQMKELGSKNQPLTKNGRTASSWWTADDNRQYNFSTKPTRQPARNYNNKLYNVGDTYDTSDGQFQIVDTQYGVGELNPLLSPQRFLGIGNQYDELIKVKDLRTNKIKEVRLDELDQDIKNGLVIPAGGNASSSTEYVAPTPETAQQNVNTSELDNAEPIDTTRSEDDRSQRVVIKEDNASVNNNKVVTPRTNNVIAPKVSTQTVPQNILPSRKVPSKVEMKKYVMPNGEFQGQEVTLIKRGDTIQVVYPNGKVETQIRNKKFGGELPKHQGNIPGVPSTVEEPINIMGDNKNNNFSFDEQAVDATVNPIAATPVQTTIANNDLFNLFDNPQITANGSQPTVASQSAVIPTAQGMQNGSLKSVATGDPNQQVIVNNDPNFEHQPKTVNTLPFTSKEKSTYEMWKPANYPKWRDQATVAMSTKQGAEAIDAALTQIAASGKYGPNINKQLEGLTGQARYNKILSLATDGKPGPFHNAFLEAITPRKPPEPIVPVEIPRTPENIPPAAFEKIPPPVPRRRPWWIQDQVNYAGAMTDTVNKYGPAMSQVDFETPGYVLADPDRQIAAIQEAAAADREAAYNTTAGNVAGASQVAPSNQRLGQAANIIAGIENQNVNTVNQALGRNAQITNQEKLTNEQFKQKYIGESATANQQYENARRALKWRQIDAFNNGTTNWMRHKQMEDVLYPNVGIDSIIGDVYFPGGRQMYDAQGRPVYDPYINPSNPNDIASLSTKNTFESRYDFWIKKGLSPEDASRNAHYEVNKTADTGTSKNSTYAQAFANGQTTPAARTSKYGGKVKKQYGGVVFDYGALPLYFFED